MGLFLYDFLMLGISAERAGSQRGCVAARSVHSAKRLWRAACGRSLLRCGLLLLAVVGVVAPISPAQALQGIAVNREYAIKGAFLYHFLTYIDWPDESLSDPAQPFVIGVYRDDPFGEVLDKIAETKQVEGRAIEIQHLESANQLEGCHILFIPHTIDAEAQKQVLAAVMDSHVLTVGETDDFIEQGGSAQFFIEGNKVRFAFNTDAVSQSQLKISSKLLSIAKVVTSTTK